MPACYQHKTTPEHCSDITLIGIIEEWNKISILGEMFAARVYKPFTYHRSGVRLHASDFADLNPHRAGVGHVPEAGHIEINRHILDTRTPG